MRFLLLILIALELCAAPRRRVSRRPAPPRITLAIRNITVIDATGAPAQPGRTLLIAGQTIVAIQDGKLPVAKGVAVVNGAGKFAIPGLWDMHVHLTAKRSMFGLYIANGVTGVRDMGSDFERTNRWRDEAMAGKRAGPMVFTSGRPVEGPGDEPLKFDAIRVFTPDDARRAVDRLEDQQTDFIKILSTISRDAYMALAQRARVLRAPFAGHLPEAVTVNDAITNRQRSMEHLFGLMMSCSSEESELRTARAAAIRKGDTAELRRIRERAYATYSEYRARQVFELLRLYKVYQTPTLTLRARLSYVDAGTLPDARGNAFVPKDVRSGWEDPRAEFEKIAAEQRADLKKDFDEHMKLTLRMARAGVPILAGTDTGDPFVAPGFALHEELEMLVRAGLHPMEALQAATLQPSRYFGEERLWGTIEKGKQADLAILDANPLEDITSTRRIHAVVLRGKLYAGKALEELLASAGKLE